ncbi:MAG: undecaprenyldiphospho-muramoylpentapeptide beta-N-acetylglucosaminyltransferase [Fibrobacteria bacterium]|nr:undecaprenyldiphospho-muramoylpentapeptide beta-N-acetylglucosaminyltransferase [Fibrobacteria bacterium]
MTRKPNDKLIVLTGGGTAGHVLPNLAIVKKLHEDGWKTVYIGSQKGIEKELVGNSMPYFSILTGKLRRYFDLQNFSDVFRVIIGTIQAFFLLRKIKPRVLFSKGGFVSVPVTVAAKWLKVPVILHESDITPGLANRISIRFAKKICTAFPETGDYLPEGVAEYTGIPVRSELFTGNRERGLSFCGFNGKKPILLITGGSLGAENLNRIVRKTINPLIEQFDIIHICGNGKIDASIYLNGYRQFEFIKSELPDIMAIADIVVSRAGANTLFELLALKKPHFLVPLSERVSRGDQILNAKSFSKQGFCRFKHEESVTPGILLKEIRQLYQDRTQFIEKMQKSDMLDSIGKIVSVIEKNC